MNIKKKNSLSWIENSLSWIDLFNPTEYVSRKALSPYDVLYSYFSKIRNDSNIIYFEISLKKNNHERN